MQFTVVGWLFMICFVLLVRIFGTVALVVVLGGRGQLLGPFFWLLVGGCLVMGSGKWKRSVDEPSLYSMRRGIVEREGLKGQFDKLVRDLRISHPDTGTLQLRNMAYESLGLDDQVTIQKYRDWVAWCAESEAAVAGELAAESARVERDLRGFEEVLGGLPLDADRGEVLVWLENHPAMIMSREAGVGGLIELTSADIADAPSRSAGGELRHWVNRKDDFYKEMLKRKAVAEKGFAKEEELRELADPTLAEVEQMLNSLESQSQ